VQPIRSRKIVKIVAEAVIHAYRLPAPARYGERRSADLAVLIERGVRAQPGRASVACATQATVTAP
jgi:hypothetical protein